jgi:hypothetical protein
MRLLLFYYVLVLLHGAVYPYALTEGLPAGAIGAFAASALTLPDPWTITAQTAVFVPLGLLAMLALAGPGQALRRLPLVLLFGAIVAVMVQAARLYVPDATASLNAVLWHILGVGLGAIWAAALRRRRSDHEADPSLARSALLLLTLWLTLRLLPLAPSLDADVVRESLRPLLVYPGFEIPTFLVETGFWLAAACLLHHLAGPRRVAGRLLLLAAATLLAAAVIVDNQVSVGDVAAVLTAWLSYGLVIKRLPGRTLLVAVLMLAAAGYQAALPPASAAAPGGISWLPFATLWREVSLVEFVRLGRMLVLWALVIWLFGAAGLGRWLGIGIAFLAALALAALGLFLAGTGADSSGPVLALLAGLLMLLVGPRRRRTGAALLDTTPAVHEAQAPAPPPVPVDEVEVETPPPPPPVAAAPQAVLETAPPARPLDPWMFILPLFWGVLLLGLFTGGLIAPRFGDWSNVLLVWLASRSVLACLALAALSLWLGAGSALGGRLVASHRRCCCCRPWGRTAIGL